MAKAIRGYRKRASQLRTAGRPQKDPGRPRTGFKKTACNTVLAGALTGATPSVFQTAVPRRFSGVQFYISDSSDKGSGGITGPLADAQTSAGRWFSSRSIADCGYGKWEGLPHRTYRPSDEAVDPYVLLWEQCQTWWGLPAPMQHGERPSPVVLNDRGNLLLDLCEALMLRWLRRVRGEAFPVTFTRPGAEQVSKSARFRVLAGDSNCMGDGWSDGGFFEVAH
eukprot:s675_g17.t1